MQAAPSLFMAIRAFLIGLYDVISALAPVLGRTVLSVLVHVLTLRFLLNHLCSTAVFAPSAMTTDMEQRMNELDEHIDILFDERDALVLQLTIANERINTVCTELGEHMHDGSGRFSGYDGLVAERRAAGRDVQERVDTVTEGLEKARELLAKLSRKVNDNMDEVKRRLRTIDGDQPGNVVTLEHFKDYVLQKDAHDTQIMVHGAHLQELATLVDTQIATTRMHDTQFKAEQARTHALENRLQTQIDELREQHSQAMAEVNRQQKDINKLKQRNEKLEDLVRALTGQQHTNTTLPAKQVVRVHSANSQNLGLGVPKGSSFKKRVTNVREFSPGKPWME